MKKLLRTLMLAAAMLLPFASQAQSTVTIGDLSTSTNNTYLPMNSLYEYSYSQQIYTADEIGMSGDITAITVWLYGNANLYQMPFDIYMLEVTDSMFSNSTSWISVDSADIVYSGSVTVHNTTDSAYTFTLDVPFSYSGTGNLLICFDNNTGQWEGGLNGKVFTAADNMIRAIYARRDGSDYDPANMSGITATATLAARNVISLEITPAGGVTCPRPGMITVSNLSAHAATINWTAGGDETQWNVYLNNTFVASASNPTYTFTGLNPETQYSVSVTAICGSEESDARNGSLTTTIACQVPTALAATLTPGDGTVATLSWTENGTATSWVLEYGTTSDFTGATSVNVTGTPSYGLTGLTAETVYYARVKADCGTDDGQSQWSPACSFEPTTKLVIGTASSTNQYLPVYTYYNYSLTQQIYTAAELGNAGAIYSIDYFCSAEKTRTVDVYMVATTKTSFDNSTDWITVTSSDLVYSGSVTFAANSWTTITLDNPFVYDGVNNVAIIFDDNTGSYEASPYFNTFSATSQAIRVYSDGTNYDPFNPTSNSGTVLNVKNHIRLVVGDAPTCARPTGVTVSYNGGTTATVSWTSDATDFNLKVNGTPVTGVITNPYTLTGLSLATSYSVEVQSVCGSETSEWTNPVSFITDLCMPADQCQLTFELTDSYGDGWNGNAIQVTDVLTNTVIATMTNQNLNGQSGGGTNELNVLTLDVCNGHQLQFTWITGSYAEETSYIVTDVNGEEIFSGAGAMTDTVYYTVNCTIDGCRKPIDLAATNVANYSAELSWTERGTSTAWEISLNGDETNPVVASSNPFTLTGLTPSTTYVAKVRSNCGTDGYSDWSDSVVFTTTEACPMPSDLAAGDVTSNGAVLSWNGNSDSYNVRYRPVIGLVQDFENGMNGWTSFDADGDSLGWVLGSAIGGVYLAEGGSLSGNGHNGSQDLISSGSYSNYTSSALTPDNYLVSPLVTLGGTISFYAQAQDAAYPYEHFGVAVSTTVNNDTNAFTTIQEWNMDAQGGSVAGAKEPGVWGFFTVDLSAYAGQTGYVAIRHFGCFDQFILNVDDIIITDPTVPNTWTEFTTADTIASISNLISGTNYEFQVQGNCGGLSTEWTSSEFFTTATDSCAAPVVTVTYFNNREVSFSWTSTGDSVYVTLLNTEGQQIVGHTFGPETTSVNNYYLPETYFPFGYGYVYAATKCGDNVYSDWAYDVFAITCDSVDQCTVAFVLNDSHGDGWNSGVLEIYDTVSGLIVCSMTAPYDNDNQIASTHTTYYNLCSDRVYSVNYRSGTNDSEVSFQIVGPDGETYFSTSNPSNGLLGYFSHSCGASDCQTIVITDANPFVEDFEDGELDECWSNISVEGASEWTVATGDYSSSTGAHTGSYNAKLTHLTSGNKTMLVTPQFDATAVTTGQLNFWYVNRSWAGDIDKLSVYYRTTSDGAWQLIDSITDAHATWTEATYFIPNSAVQVAFMMVDDYGYGVAIDDVTIGAVPTCLPVNALTAILTPGDGTVATLSWSPAGNESAWQICLNDDNTNLISVTDTFYNLTGLIAETIYTAKVRAICGASEISEWCYPISFQPTVKVVVGTASATNSYLPTYTYYNYSLTQQIYTAAELGNSGSISSIDYFCSDEKTRTVDVYMVATTKTSFDSVTDWIAVSASDLVYSGSVTFAANSWTTITLDNPFVYDGVNNVAIIFDDNTGSWESSPTFSAFSATSQAVRIYSDGVNYDPFNPASYIGTVMDVKNHIRLAIGDAPTCARPTELTVVATTANSVSLSWTDALNTGATYTVYEVNATGETVVATGINATNYTVTGLNASTTYTFGVVANCSATDASTMATISATTDCAGGSCNIFIYAQDSYGDGWNGNTIDVMQGLVTAGSYSMPGQGVSSTVIYDTAVVSVCAGQPISFSWTTGQWADEVTFSIANASGEIVYTGYGSDMTNGTFLTIDSCNVAGLAPDTTTVTIAVNDATMGTVTPAPGTYQLVGDEAMTITATPNSGYHFLHWEFVYTFSGVLDTTTIIDNPISVSEVPYLSPMTFTAIFEQDAVCNGTTCDLVITGSDEWGDGWNGGSLNVLQNNVLVNSFAVTDSADTVSIEVCSDYPVDFSWTSGSWDSEVSFSVSTLSGTEIFSVSTASILTDGEVFATVSNPCTNPVVTYSVDSFTVTLAVNDATMGTTIPAPGVYQVSPLDVMTVVATPNAGYYFQGWASSYNYDGVVYYDTVFSATYDTLNIEGDYWAEVESVTFTALFTDQQYVGDSMLVNIYVNDPTMGTTNPAPGAHYFYEGETCSVVAMPYPGYMIEGWYVMALEDGDTVIDEYVPYPFTDVFEIFEEPFVVGPGYGDIEFYVTAHFTEDTSTSQEEYLTLITAVNDATMGTVTPEPGTHYYYLGDVINFSATPYEGYHAESADITIYLMGIPLIDSTVSLGNMTTFDLEVEEFFLGATISITVNFASGEMEEAILNVDVNNANMGYVLVNGEQTATYVGAVGETVTLEAVANNGFAFQSWSDGNTSANRDLVLYDAVTSITANFIQNEGIDIVGMLNDLKVYPNPTHGIVNIDAEDVVKVEVMDLNGRVAAVYENSNRVDLSDLNAGTYMLRIQTTNGTAVRRVVKK